MHGQGYARREEGNCEGEGSQMPTTRCEHEEDALGKGLRERECRKRDNEEKGTIMFATD